MAGFEWEIEVGEDVDVADGQNETPLHEQPDPADFDSDPADLEKELDAATAAGIPIDLNAFSKTTAGLKIAHLAFHKRKRARLNSKVARLRRQAENEKGNDDGGRKTRSGTWSPQHPLNELDVPRTFGSYGTFIPGVTTQRQRVRPDPRGTPRSRKFAHMNFIIDISGSMSIGVSPSRPLDLRVKVSEDDPWQPFSDDGGPIKHVGVGIWDSDTPLMPDPRGPNKGYPRWEIRVPMGLGFPDEGQIIDPTTIRRVMEVAVEVCFAMLQEARKRKNTVSVFSFHTVGKKEISKTRDYNKAEKVLLGLEPTGSTSYAGALRLAAAETMALGGKAMTILVTDALLMDLSALAPAAQTPDARYMHELTKAGPFFLVCLGQDPEKNADLKALLKAMREGYGANFEVGAFPDVTSEDAVFAAARWSVRL